MIRTLDPLPSTRNCPSLSRRSSNSSDSTSHDRKPLRANRCADGFAERWTKHMATKRVLEHQSVDPFFGCPHTSSAGENIAYGYDTPRALVSAWMHSKGHRANILSRHFNRIGVSGWRATDGVTYATQDFLGG